MADVSYDKAVIQQAANKLYAQARTVTVLYTIAGVVVGAVAGSFAVQVSEAMPLVGALVLALVAFQRAREKTFTLRLQAQAALCQVRIEENTSRAGV